MGRSLYGPEAWPEDARWLDPAIVPALQIAIVKRGLRDILIAENPLGSNRSPTIDHYLRRARVPESVILSHLGYWCGAEAGAIWEDSGAEIPDDYGAVVAWVTFAKQTGTWVSPADVAKYSNNEIAGYAAVFAAGGTPNHVGIVTRWDRVHNFLSGNTSSNGLSSNGTMVAVHDFPTAGLAGFVRPVARVA